MSGCQVLLVPVFADARLATLAILVSYLARYCCKVAILAILAILKIMTTLAILAILEILTILAILAILTILTTLAILASYLAKYCCKVVVEVLTIMWVSRVPS